MSACCPMTVVGRLVGTGGGSHDRIVQRLGRSVRGVVVVLMVVVLSACVRSSDPSAELSAEQVVDALDGVVCAFEEESGAMIGAVRYWECDDVYVATELGDDIGAVGSGVALYESTTERERWQQRVEAMYPGHVVGRDNLIVLSPDRLLLNSLAGRLP